MRGRMMNGCSLCDAQLRQCEVLRREDEAGQQLTDEERRKLTGMSEWQQELATLEA